MFNFFCKPEKDREDINSPGANLEYYPLGKITDKKMPTQGKFKNNYPVGAVVHFTAGSSAESSISYGTSQGYAFWMIDKKGQVYQTHSIREWGHHAGSSSHPVLGFNLSTKLLGIEIDCAGRLTKEGTKLKSWFGREVEKEQARYSPNKENIQQGWYESFTPEQEQALIQLLLWLKFNNPTVFNLDYVFGHDEICSPKGRKNDPGASLSMTMPKFRDLLFAEYVKRYPEKAE